MNKKNETRLRAFALAGVDLLMVGVVLVVFALFHHVIPQKGEALANIVNPEQEAVPAFSAHTSLSAPSSPPEASPAPTVYPAGDFSASFPVANTGEGALYSYQSDDLRIAISHIQQDGITYYLADVWVRNIESFETAFAKGQYGKGIHQRPVEMAEEAGAVFAVTGDYFGARSKGVVIRNGDLYRDSLYRDVCVLYFDGVMETYSNDVFDMPTAIANNAWQAWSFGPKLLNGGMPIEDFSDSIKGKNPRCAIGYYEPGHYCFVVVDGRQPGYSKGMTLAELSQLFYTLGCKAAYNLDGGATAEMIFQGKVVNKPYKGGRESSDIICIGKEG